MNDAIQNLVKANEAHRDAEAKLARYVKEEAAAERRTREQTLKVAEAKKALDAATAALAGGLAKKGA